MQNIRLILSYCGSAYVGWQKTPMGRSIEETLEKVLEQIVRHPVQLQAASRTDAGVHAEGQVVNFFLKNDISLRRLKHSLNGLLPKDISVVSAEEAPETFHPTLDSSGKEYWYHICNGSVQLPFFRHVSWHFPYPLDLEKMERGAERLIGEHDFSAFCNERSLWDRDAVCHLKSVAIIPLEDQRLRLVICGDHFLYKMVRNIAGTLAYVGCGKIAPEAVEEILKSKERKNAGVTAPAHGLILKRVIY